MITKMISDWQYEVTLHDWVITHEDYVAGYVCRVPFTNPEDFEGYFWHFYGTYSKAPLNVGDLRKLYEFIAELNEKL